MSQIVPKDFIMKEFVSLQKGKKITSQSVTSKGSNLDKVITKPYTLSPLSLVLGMCNSTDYSSTNDLQQYIPEKN